jgi:hypothetical protein
MLKYVVPVALLLPGCQQSPAADKATIDNLRQRVERLEVENALTRRQVGQLTNAVAGKQAEKAVALPQRTLRR